MPIDRSNIVTRQVKKYTCLCCGQSFEDPKTRFFRVPYSPLYSSNDCYSGFCVECADRVFKDLTAIYGGRQALFIMCHYFDMYYSESIYNSIKDKTNYSLGLYAQKTALVAYKNKNFATTLSEMIDGGWLSLDRDVKAETNEVKWSNEDVRNKNFILHTLGYDCFGDDSYDDADLKFLYNTMADYIGDDTVEDPHKLQSVIELVKTMLQREKIDRIINQELSKHDCDEKFLRELSTVKTQYNSVINDIANENAISAKASGKKQAGTNTLSYIMKQMADDGFEEIKPNVYNAKMEASFREIAQANAKALFEELSLQPDDYARLCGEQSEKIRSMQDDIDKLTEENRLLRIHKFKQGGKSNAGNSGSSDGQRTESAEA